MEDNYKEVYFSQYCKTCAYEMLSENEEPCNGCLDIPTRPDSHKPEMWEEKK
jgi:hypothetical protein